MSKKMSKSNGVPARSISPELASEIEQDGGTGLVALEPIVQTVVAEEARRRRALVSPTGSDIEAVRQGDRAVALERLANRLSHGWVEAAWGGDPMTVPAWEALTPHPWNLTDERFEILKRLAAHAKVTLDALRQEILKSAVIAVIHDDDRPAWRSVHWAIFGGDSPEGADQLIGRLKPGEINDWDIYMRWFHRRALAVANAFLDEEQETESTVVAKVPFDTGSTRHCVGQNRTRRPCIADFTFVDRG